jgi:hypothetical protein
MKRGPRREMNGFTVRFSRRCEIKLRCGPSEDAELPGKDSTSTSCTGHDPVLSYSPPCQPSGTMRRCWALLIRDHPPSNDRQCINAIAGNRR